MLKYYILIKIRNQKEILKEIGNKLLIQCYWGDIQKGLEFKSISYPKNQKKKKKSKGNYIKINKLVKAFEML